MPRSLLAGASFVNFCQESSRIPQAECAYSLALDPVLAFRNRFRVSTHRPKQRNSLFLHLSRPYRSRGYGIAGRNTRILIRLQYGTIMTRAALALVVLSAALYPAPAVPPPQEEKDIADTYVKQIADFVAGTSRRSRNSDTSRVTRLLSCPSPWNPPMDRAPVNSSWNSTD